MRSRSLRRHHQERLKRRVRRYYSGAHRNDPDQIGLLATTRKPCSCWMCENPRRYQGEKIRQEVRAEQRERPARSIPIDRLPPPAKDEAMKRLRKKDIDAFRRTAGAWKGPLDAEALIRAIYRDRLVSTRPAPRL